MVRVLVLILVLASAQAWGCAGQKSTAEDDRRAREAVHRAKAEDVSKCGPEYGRRRDAEEKAEADRVAKAKDMAAAKAKAEAERAAAERRAREVELKATVERARKP